MAGTQEVLRARKNIASVLGLNFEHVEMNPNDRGGVSFRLTRSPVMDEGDIGNLREAIRSATGLGRVANVEAHTGSDNTLSLINVLAFDTDDAIERVAKMNPEAVRKEVFSGRRFV